MMVFHDRFPVLMGDIRRAVLRCICRDGKLTLEEKVCGKASSKVMEGTGRYRSVGMSFGISNNVGLGDSIGCGIDTVKDPNKELGDFR